MVIDALILIKMHTIYLIRNSENNKIYIGQTSKTPEYRLKRHIYDAHYGSSDRIHKAIRKYGDSNFCIETLGTLDNKKETDEIESFCIMLFNSMNPYIGYNICEGGEGVTWTKELREKMSRSRMGDKNPMFGTKLPQKEIDRLRTSFSGKNNPNYRRDLDDQKISALYLSGHSSIEISKEFSVSFGTILYRLRKNGVHIRTDKEAAYTRENHNV